MRILAFETSAKAASAAILEDGKLLCETYQNGGMTHSETLLAMAQQQLQSCHLTVEDIDAVAVAKGPGSFTGVRIGVAAAKGFAWGREIPLYGVSTLEAMAYAQSIFEGLICPCMDARRNETYTALFRSHRGEITRLREDRAIRVAELGEDLKNFSEPILFVGDGAELCMKALGGDSETYYLSPEHRRHQRASGVALAAQKAMEAGDPGDGAALQPNYLRLSQAERERKQRLEAEAASERK